jgi:hypothetical protein
MLCDSGHYVEVEASPVPLGVLLGGYDTLSDSLALN